MNISYSHEILLIYYQTIYILNNPAVIANCNDNILSAIVVTYQYN